MKKSTTQLEECKDPAAIEAKIRQHQAQMLETQNEIAQLEAELSKG